MSPPRARLITKPKPTLFAMIPHHLVSGYRHRQIPHPRPSEDVRLTPVRHQINLTVGRAYSIEQ